MMNIRNSSSLNLVNELLNKFSKSKIDKKPKSNYFPRNGYALVQHRLEPIARILLIGVYDDKHALSIFRGMRYIIKIIWELTIQFNHHVYAPYIQSANDPFTDKIDYNSFFIKSDPLPIAFNRIDGAGICFHSICYEMQDDIIDYKSLKFPQPLRKEININMMPIKMDPDILKDQLPANLYGYIPWIKACLQADQGGRQLNKICYLTIHESFVEKGKTQRRPGLHIEQPGTDKIRNGQTIYDVSWGGGYNHNDGIFIASNISDTCAVWNCTIINSKKYNNDVKVIGNLGNMEHLRSIISKYKRYSLKGGKLYWITDKTPHEALAMKKSGYRQFFRFVSSKLSVWYEDHSTKNRIGIVPDPKITKIIKGNKFNS